MNKIGIDTNIFIYAMDKSSIHHKNCVNILNDIENDLCTSTKNISEYFAVCTKINVNRDKMYSFYQEIKNNIKIFYPTKKSLEIFEFLNKKYKPKGNRVYDIEIVSIFLSKNINKIATINRKDFKNIIEIELIDLDQY